MYTPELLDEARKFMHHMLTKVVEYGGSDLFITADFPPSIKQQGLMKPFGQQKLAADKTRLFAYALMNERQIKEFESVMECNFGISVPGVSRFRVNVFQQQHNVGMVIRTITTEIPSFQQLGLPNSLQQVIMEKRGLVLIVGATGVGKSTTLAAMIDHRNTYSEGHIITIEDPVEYVYQHKKSMITQREIGVDCVSWHNALINTMRQAPDVIVIGEIRDTESMEHAIAFAESGHLCLATLHSNNADQALDRIINFFPEERRNQLLMDLSANMKAVISQRLIRTEDGQGRRAAVEILLNTPLVSDFIRKGDFYELKTIMARSRELGMQTFDQALFDLYNQGIISYDEALRNADSSNEMRLQIKLKSSRINPALQEEGSKMRILEQSKETTLSRN
ncbi:type IV pilus twitching motility protein PilT [Acinetobacter schindleri]|jgi:twitching motility protein PilU|uniref:PilT/PilU family type 4a pilus ATPase n=1 Tax=Acinetobacter TaxID=469 RepID=UPI0006621492|nr:MULTISPECIES: PilT/PilU family type 4a pilus ATPase [Acinetobacter]KMV00891.1 twitching motility protein PilT [Acinetobacter sp. VT 511]MBB4836094.1 twitching motility protein PilU [Acinetobacter schindleri]PUR00066.1 type IV pilus twitching motility protein PilT [Acinetobacter schindleri]WBX39357.1 PilT/PilU family type 4a pilus ATPase [Acinetobacter schindleri]